MAQKKDNRTTTQSDVSDFPLHAFPKKILEMANGLADSESFHIEYLLVSMVSAIASATGNALQIRIKGGWTSSPIFYIILVGRPGLGKTPQLELYAAGKKSAIREGKNARRKRKLNFGFWPRCIKYQAEQNYGVGLYTRSIDASPQCQSTRYRCFCR